MVVVRVDRYGVADRAGIEQKDVVLRIDGLVAKEMHFQDAYRMLCRPGTRRLVVKRADQEIKFTLMATTK
jgi:C-terminal processing protease CtpA/Prc